MTVVWNNWHLFSVNKVCWSCSHNLAITFYWTTFFHIGIFTLDSAFWYILLPGFKLGNCIYSEYQSNDFHTWAPNTQTRTNLEMIIYQIDNPGNGTRDLLIQRPLWKSLANRGRRNILSIFLLYKAVPSFSLFNQPRLPIAPASWSIMAILEMRCGFFVPVYITKYLLWAFLLCWVAHQFNMHTLWQITAYQLCRNTRTRCASKEINAEVSFRLSEMLYR